MVLDNTDLRYYDPDATFFESYSERSKPFQKPCRLVRSSAQHSDMQQRHDLLFVSIENFTSFSSTLGT